VACAAHLPEVPLFIALLEIANPFISIGNFLVNNEVDTGLLCSGKQRYSIGQMRAFTVEWLTNTECQLVAVTDASVHLKKTKGELLCTPFSFNP
jgi:hypothetical protein